jgi:pimeloyl-ACP methyl ester carboxylesterase
LALAQVVSLKAPVFAERAIIKGELTTRLLRAWGGPGWPGRAEASTYRTIMRIPFAASKALEQLRWAAGVSAGAGTRRFASRFTDGARVPVLHIQGALDRLLRPGALAVPSLGGQRYEWYQVPGAGHYVPEEAPEACSDLLLGWLARSAR